MNVLTHGSSQRSKLDQAQNAIASIDAQIEEIDSAELPLQDVADVIDRTLDRERDNSSIPHLLRSAAFPDRDLDLRDVKEGGDFRVSTIALLDQFLGRAEIKKRWISVITSDKSYAPGLQHEERQKRIAALRAERGKLERTEELEAMRIEDATGALILRRRDADVNLLLELWR